MYGDKLTTGQDELQVYWLQTGVAGLQWPYLFDDYALVWPSDPARYSFYLRPPAASATEASLTAVQLAVGEAPTIDYQDPLDQPRAFLTPGEAFYTWLTSAYPAQRALLRFNVPGHIRFERVFSILAPALQGTVSLDRSVATNLSAWNPANLTLTNFASNFNPPYVTNQTVNVGDQIAPPFYAAIDPAGGDYWAGFINTNAGTFYDVDAYQDPFANGFATANLGAIIPINAIPGFNKLEVWWFRQNNANQDQGFHTVYWPSIIGQYTLQWPSNAPLIVLASNDGSGPLDSLRAAGSIYYQNDPTKPGYNPNEEHAVMLGGQAYALRDDLNVTNANNFLRPFKGNSSAPFVLVSYFGSDGRPAMSVFKVQREDRNAGVYFDYVVKAGTQLQAPMPLPLLTPPIVFGSQYPHGFTNYDTEPKTALNGDLPTGWISTDTTGPFSLYANFTFEDRNNTFWVYRGLNSGLPAFKPALMTRTSINSALSLPLQRSLTLILLTLSTSPGCWNH